MTATAAVIVVVMAVETEVMGNSRDRRQHQLSTMLLPQTLSSIVKVLFPIYNLFLAKT